MMLFSNNNFNPSSNTSIAGSTQHYYSAAYRWIYNDTQAYLDNMEEAFTAASSSYSLTLDAVLEGYVLPRFVLATLYFATNGNEWVNQSKQLVIK